MLTSWRALYHSDLQGFYALVLVPAVFLLWLLRRSPAEGGAEPRAARFVRTWALVFAVETILDPSVTGPVLRLLGITRGFVADYAMIPFVLLGDFRVFLLLFRLLAPDEQLGAVLTRAAAWTLLVPLVAVTDALVMRTILGDLPDQTVWLVYESLFAVLALSLRGRLVVERTHDRPALRDYLRAILAYVATYYALWAIADLMTLARHDRGWALRIVPNQLYYAFWVPFAYLRFFSARYASTNRSTQAAR